MDRAAKILAKLNVLDLDQSDFITIAIQIIVALVVIVIVAGAMFVLE